MSPDTSAAQPRAGSKLLAIRWRKVRPLAAVAALPDYARALAFLSQRPSRAPSGAETPQITDSGFDIVTVVFRAELDLLMLQARSFDRFLDPSFAGRIIVIVNDLRCDHVVARIRADVLSQYGRWCDRVEIVPFHALARRLDPANGWIIQQVLKLTCARMMTRPHYVVFDAKNHLVAPTSTSRFVDNDGFALQTFEHEHPRLPEHDRACASYFGFDPAAIERIRLVPMTPFVVHTQTARDLARDIEIRENASLSDFFCDRRFMSEFILYGAYLEAGHVGVAGRYRDVPCKTVGLWKNDKVVDQAIADVIDWDAFCLGTHRETLAMLGAADRTKLTRFWRERGLLGPKETLADFSTASASRRRVSAPGDGRVVAVAMGVAIGVLAGIPLVSPVPFAAAHCLAASSAGLLVAAVRTRGWAANALLAAASVVFVTAIGAAVVADQSQDIRVDGETGLIAKGGPLGWSLRPGAHHVVKTINGKTIYDVTYTIDAQGQRVTQSATTGKAVAFLGDSFTFGEGVADADTLPQSFADRLGRKVQVLNFGVPAYSPAQVLRALQLGLYDDKLRSADTFFMLTASWHADRVACKDDWVVGAPRYVTRNGTLISDGQCQKLPEPGPVMAWIRETPAYRALFAWRLPSVDHADIDNYINVVAETVKVSHERYGASMKLLYLRNAGYLRFTGYTDDDVIGKLRARGAEVLEMTLPHEGKAGVAIPGDGHPNGAGNRMRAGMLVDAADANDPNAPTP